MADENKTRDASYTKMTAEVYDAIYGFKDYKKEASRLLEIINDLKKTNGKSMLDVACGTGSHIPFLSTHFDITGLDLSEEQLVEAKRRLPSIEFHQGDMIDFNLGKKFNVVTCLFSSIGYAIKLEDMRKAVKNMVKHLLPGGILIIEPWIAKGDYIPGTVHAVFVDEPNLKISRINTSEVVDGRSVMDMHHLVGRPTGVEYFVEHHEQGLYTDVEYLAAIKDAGLLESKDEYGLMGRGLFIGVKSK